jgi:LacI family transcriptional regulator
VGFILMANIRDVARKAGVAPITVSRVINNSGYVSDAVRVRVASAITELNYIPNQLGPSMRSKRSNTIGIIVTDITNPFWTTVVRGVEDAAYKAGYHLFLCNSDESVDKEQEYVELLLSRQVDGILIAPAENDSDSLRVIQAQGKSVVTLDRRITNRQVDSVRCDSVDGTYALTKHLLEEGHQHIALLTGSKLVSTAVDRADGYSKAMTEAGFREAELTILWGKFTQDSGYQQTLELLQMQPRPTAIITANNFIAIGAVRLLDEMGLQIPDDISLVTFDDLPDTIMVRPFLTTVAQPAYEMGFLAANMLFERLGSSIDVAVKEIILPLELKVRFSTCPPQKRRTTEADIGSHD